MTNPGRPDRRCLHRHLRMVAPSLMCGVLLLSTAAVLPQPVTADQGNSSTILIQRQGLQKQRLIQGQAATELSQSQAKDLTPMPQPGQEPSLAPEVAAASAPKPVTEADVLLQRQQRI